MQHFRMDRGLLNSFIIFLLLLLAAAFVLLRFDFTPADDLKIGGRQGEMRLAFWYPDTSEPLPLNAEWLGFPDQLLTPDAVERNLASSVPVRFPDIWQPPKPRRHIMTYTLMLKRIPQNVALGLKIPEIKNSFRLYLNEREIASGGFASDSIDQHEAYFGDRIVSLGTLPENARLTLQVSNFGHSRGGVHNVPVLATQAHWVSDYRFNILVECVVISLALIAGFLILLEYYLVPEHGELLWISLFSLVLAGYIGTSGLGGFATLIPGFPWQLAVRMEYIGFVAAIPLFLNWLAALFRDDIDCQPIRWISWAAVALTAFVTLTPSSLFTGMLYPVLSFMCIGIAFCSWAMLKLVILNRSGVRMLAFGALALVGGILHDLFLFLNWLPGRELLSVGVLVFLVSQIGFLTFYRTQEQLRILDQNNTLQNATQELKSRLRWRSDELKLKDEEVEQRKAETQRLLRHDGLTGLLNRHHFLELVERRLERMSPFDFSLVIVDIDHYKLIVDQHGREFAEEVLRQTANVLTKVCSGQFDRIPARYGGDEFILWLGRSSKEEAEELARHIRKMVSRIELPVGSDSVCRFSLSTGVATASAGDGISQDQLNTLLAKAADAVHHSRHLQRSNSPLSRTPKVTAGTSMVRGRV